MASSAYDVVSGEEKNKRRGMGIASLVIGLVGVLCLIIAFFVAGLPLSIACVILGTIGIILGAYCLNKNLGNSIGVAGFIISICVATAGFITMIIMIVALSR